MRRLAMVLLPLALAACEVETRSPTEGHDKVTLSANEEGRIAFDLPFAKGEVKLPASLMENSKFDIDGVQMIPGGSVTGFNLDTQGNATRVHLRFKAPVNAAEARSYFLDQFKQKGVAAAAAAGEAITGTSKDGAAFVMRFAEAGGGSTGTVELQPKK